MRSRYTAFVLKRSDYLLASWHPDTRPSRIRFDDTRWLALDIIGLNQGSATQHTGTVTFRAAFMDSGECKVLQECSRVEKLDNSWYYRDGDCSIEKLGRNAFCPCGSGKKLQRCCASN